MDKFYDIISEDEITLVDFYAAWCGPCKTMQPILEEYKKQVGDKVRILKLDVDSPANASLSHKYRVSAVPTLIFFRKGEIKWRGSGVISALRLREISDKL